MIQPLPSFCSAIAEGFTLCLGSYCLSEMFTKQRGGELFFLNLNFSRSSLLKMFHESSQPFPTARFLESVHGCYGSRHGPGPEAESERKQPHNPGLCMPGVADTCLSGPHLSGKLPQTQLVKNVLHPDFSPGPHFLTQVSCSSLEFDYLFHVQKRYPRTSIKASCHVSRVRCNLQATSNLAGEPGLRVNPGCHWHRWHIHNQKTDISK